MGGTGGLAGGLLLGNGGLAGAITLTGPKAGVAGDDEGVGDSTICSLPSLSSEQSKLGKIEGVAVVAGAGSKNSLKA